MDQVAAGHRVQVQIPEMNLAGASHRHMNQKNCQMSQIYQCQMHLKERCFTLICQSFSFISTSFTHQESCKRQKGFGCYSWSPNKVVLTIILFSSVPFGKISKFEVKGTKPLDTIQCCPNCLLNSRPYSKVLVFIRLYITCFPLSIGNPFPPGWFQFKLLVIPVLWVLSLWR